MGANRPLADPHLRHGSVQPAHEAARFERTGKVHGTVPLKNGSQPATIP